MQLGSEWQRVQLKMKQLKLKNTQCNQFIHKHNRLLKSFNAKLVKSTKVIEKLESKSEKNKSMPIEKAAIDALSNELQECIAVIKPDDDTKMCYSKEHNRNLNLNFGDKISFDDDLFKTELKSALTYFKTNLFKNACLCNDDDNGSCSSKNKNSKACVFCHLFVDKHPESVVVVPSINLETVLIEHSYCKHPKKTKQQQNVDFDDDLLVDNLVNERLNRLFEKNSKNKNLFDADNSESKDKRIVEAGFDLDSSETKKLPNLSNEELSFLSDELESSKGIDHLNPNIIEIEFDGNPNDLVVNFEELENDPNHRFQMVIGNNKQVLVQQQSSNTSEPTKSNNQTISSTHLFNNCKFTNYRNVYNLKHKRARLS
jgi:hypothetical protein